MDSMDFIRKRITELRLQKRLAETTLSNLIGHGDTYIHKITSGKSNISLPELLVLIDFFGISLKEFFDDGYSTPVEDREILETMKNLSDDNLLYSCGSCTLSEWLLSLYLNVQFCDLG